MDGVHQVVESFSTYLLHQYFHEQHEYDELISGDLRLGDVLAENSDLLPGMVRSLWQSPAMRLDHEFWLNPRIHVCPRCELPIPQNGEVEAETMTFTSCCVTAVHTQCFIPGTLSCEVCSHENCNVRIPVFLDGPQMLSFVTIRDMLLDHQGHRWSLYQRHEDCYVYQRADWSMVHHCSRIHYEEVRSYSQSNFSEFMQIAYVRGYYSRTHGYWPVGSGPAEYLNFKNNFRRGNDDMWVTINVYGVLIKSLYWLLFMLWLKGNCV